MGRGKQAAETAVHGIFLLLGLITVGCVLLITVYLILSGIPAIRQIGLPAFLLGGTWASTAEELSFGILPFILTSVYGTAGAILFGVPLGFFTAVYLAKLAPPKVKAAVGAAVSLLAGIPSVVYGLVGMLILVPGIRRLFHVPDGAGLLSAIIVLAIMILPSIIKVSAPAAKSGVAAAVVLDVGHIREMAAETIKMVTESVDSYVHQDTALAKRVIAHDNIIDSYFTRVRAVLIKKIVGNPSAGEHILDLLMIGKYLERIGDHAVNIAEWVIFSVTGTREG